jgi:thioredoxin-like negative regulator of GroEL
MPITDIKSVNEFQKMLTQKKVMCLYYWDFCGHCHTYMPIWTKVVLQTKIPVAKMELSTMQQLPAQYKVSGFPIVVIYENGKITKELVGSKQEPELHKFIVDNFDKKTPSKTPNVAPKKMKSSPKPVDKKKSKKMIK